MRNAAQLWFTLEQLEALHDRVSSGWEVSDDRTFWEPLLNKIEAARDRARLKLIMQNIFSGCARCGHWRQK